MEYKARKYRIYPNKEQRILFAKTFGCVRFVYNHFLARRIEVYEKEKKSLSYNKCSTELTELKKEYTFLKEVDSVPLQQALKHLDTAYENFFNKSGFPKFKSKHKSKKSYTTVITNNNIRIEGKYIILPKVGKVKIKLHREVDNIRSVTVSQTPTGKYFVSVLFAYENQVQKVTPQKFLGLDYSLPYLYIDSDGNEPDFEKPFRKYQDKLAKEQRKLSKMCEDAKGRKLSECKNYQKQKVRVAKIHEKIANCRKDALHKLSYELAENYDAIGVENLNLQGMSHMFGKSVMDNGYGTLLKFLEYKLNDRGKYLFKASRWYPSTKTCSCCGNIKPMKLSDREYVCPVCGTIIDRDWNAAINLRDEAIRTAGQAGIARTTTACTHQAVQ